MEKKKYKGLRAIFIITEIFLVAVILILVVKIIPVHWKINDKYAITINNANGQMQAVSGQSYAKMLRPNEYFTIMMGKNPRGDSYIGNQKINNKMVAITTDYIETYGIDTKISLHVNFATDNDLSYTISGAPNGETWEIWISFENISSPQILIYDNAGVKS